MRHTCKTLLMATAIATVGCQTSQKTTEAPLEVRWEMGENLPDRTYTNSFTIFNRSDKPLEQDWVIYFSQLPRVMINDSLATVRVERINGDFFRMYPTEAFAGLQPGDSLRVDFRATAGVIKEGHCPMGMYIVYNKDGRESEPIVLPLEIVPFDNEKQWTRPYAREYVYPGGERMYELNSRVTPATASATDMIPSVKSLKTGQAEVTVPKQIAIKAEAGFEGEAKLLGEKLTKAFGAEITDNAPFVVTIGQLTGKDAVNDEAYTVALTADGAAIKGATAQGAFHGTHTFANLLRGASLPATLSEVTIADYPDFGYRGVMIDVSRNFIKKENILKLLDLFADYKINTLHFHLTDDEGWRLEIPGIEELTTVGAHRGHTLDEAQWIYPAYGSGPSATDMNSAGNGFYTRQDFIDILRYANERHIRVVPEVDVPGHSRAAIRAMKARYNKYITTDSIRANEYMLFDPNDHSKYHSAQDYTDCALSVALPATYRFVDKVMGEIKAMYDEAGAPIDQVHIGGDEVPSGAWTDAPVVAELMEREGIKDSKGLNDYFFRHADNILKGHGLKMSGWQELIFDHGASVKESNVGNPAGYGNIYCWSTMGNYDVIPYSAANAGFDIILCNVTNLYLDLAYNRHQSEPGLHWGGYTDEVKGFDVQPYNLYSSIREEADGTPRDLTKAAAGKPALKAEARGRIKGMQGQLWAETVTEFPRTEYMLFPKIFGLSERSWNAQPAWGSMKGAEADAAYRADLSKFYNTLTQRELPYLSTQEVNFRVNQPGFKVEDGKVIFNAIDPNAEIYYTLDGTTPTTASARWDGTPVALDNQDAQIRAIAVVRGLKSVVTR